MLDFSFARFSRLLCALMALLIFPALACQAQKNVPGVTPTSILIGSCAPLDGPASFLGMQIELGALTYFHMVNDQGGVHGRTIELHFFDDGYDPEKTAKCFDRLNKQEVFAIGFLVGTSTSLRYVPLAEADKIPVVGLFTGAPQLYEPPKHYVICVRASYADEAHVLVDNLWKARGIRKIGLIYQDDAFGKAVLDEVEGALSAHQGSLVATGKFPRNTLEVAEGMKAVREAKPEAVILAGPYAPVGAILKQAHSTGWNPMFLATSFAAPEGLVRAAGSDADGVIISEVVPGYDRTDVPTAKLYRAALEKYSQGTSPSYVSFEGFVDAMVLVEGLKRAGKDLTREKLISAIESIQNQDVGLGPRFMLDYGAKDHKGFESVDAIVMRGGRAVQITDWKNLPTQ